MRALVVLRARLLYTYTYSYSYSYSSYTHLILNGKELLSFLAIVKTDVCTGM